MSGKMHIGRSWTGHRLEDECPCPKAPCGLVEIEFFGDNGCKEHDVSEAKTIRQMHPDYKCPELKG
jgi:hypothetical protein